MRKPTWWDLGIAVLGLVLVCGAARGEAQTPYSAQQTPSPDASVGDVTQDSRITGTSDGMGSDQGLPTGATAPQTGTGGAGTDTGQGMGQAAGTQDETEATQQPSQVDAQQRVEIARLRTQVAELEEQLAQMRVALARAQAAAQGTGGGGEGTGGSGEDVGVSGQDAGVGGQGGSGQGVEGRGTAAMGGPNVEAPAGASGAGPSTSERVGSGGTAGQVAAPSPEGYAVVSVIHRGRVRSVNPQQLVIEEEGGGSNTLSLARDVRVVSRNGQPLALSNLKEGTLVRTSADLYTRGNPVTSIEVLSASSGSRR